MTGGFLVSEAFLEKMLFLFFSLYFDLYNPFPEFGTLLMGHPA